MAQVISFVEVLRERRRAREREHTAECVEIIQASLRLAVHLLSKSPREERAIRARQVRQLAELFEYVVRDS
jgi:hypothetical protein